MTDQIGLEGAVVLASSDGLSHLRSRRHTGGRVGGESSGPYQKKGNLEFGGWRARFAVCNWRPEMQ